MKNIIFCSIFLCCSLMLGCNRNIDNKFNEFEKMTVTTPVETTNYETTSDDTTEETTEEIIENVDEMLLLQKVMLNQMKVVNPYVDGEEYYLKDDIFSEYYSFGVFDLGNDGVCDVILYNRNEHTKLSVLYVLKGKVYCTKLYESSECYKDGFLGFESDYVITRYKYNPRTGEDKKVLSINYDFQGNITKGEEYLQYYEQFSKTPITKYEFTEENILEYVK